VIFHLPREVVLLLASGAASAASNAASGVEQKAHTHGYSYLSINPRRISRGCEGRIQPATTIVNPSVIIKNGNSVII
jgi:hypothetical protein